MTGSPRTEFGIPQKDKYVIDNIRWTRSGPRQGILRRRQWKQRIWRIGEAADVEVAAALLAAAPLYANECVLIYDQSLGGVRIGGRYGQKWIWG